MALFDDLANKLTGGAAASGAGGVVPVILSLLNNKGGISGLVDAFQKAGLGNIVSSWIGTGENLPISAEQIGRVFGNDQVEAFADQAGVPREAAGSRLAELLPGIVDKLTPGGQMPQGDLMSAGMRLLGSMMPGKPGS